MRREPPKRFLGRLGSASVLFMVGLGPVVGLAAGELAAVGLAGGADAAVVAPASNSVAAFGAPALSDANGTSLNSPLVALAPTPDHGGYWLLGSDGGVFSYGDASSTGRPARWSSISPSWAWPPTPEPEAIGW